MSKPHGIKIIISGFDFTISLISNLLECSPVLLIMFIPPAISIISGTQCPAVKNGSIHSIARTFGILFDFVFLMFLILFSSELAISLAFSLHSNISPNFKTDSIISFIL